MDDRPNPPPHSSPSSWHGDAPQGDLAQVRHPQPAADVLRPAGPTPLPARRPGRPWGFWATIGWTLFLFAVFLGTEVVAITIALGLEVYKGITVITPQTIERLATNGFLLAVLTLFRAPLVVGLAAFFAGIRMPVTDYLGLRRLRWRETLWSVLALSVLQVTLDLTVWGLDRPIVGEFQLALYRTAGSLPILVLALVVGAPVLEEVLFRGFVFKGLAASKAGAAGAVLLTSAIWALIHFQYDWYNVLQIFAVGLFLGVVRWRTGSVTLPILLHGLMNAVATAQTVIIAEGWA